MKRFVIFIVLLFVISCTHIVIKPDGTHTETTIDGDAITDVIGALDNATKNIIKATD